jgi:hypothetical protein
MDDCVIQEIAAEDEGSRLERERLEEKVVSLRGLLDHLRLLDRHHLTGMMTEFRKDNSRRRETDLFPDVRGVEEQLNGSVEHGDDSSPDQVSVQDSSQRDGEELVPDDHVSVEMDAPVVEVERAPSPAENLDGLLSQSKKVSKKKKKHPEAIRWE